MGVGFKVAREVLGISIPVKSFNFRKKSQYFCSIVRGPISGNLLQA